MSFRLLPLRAGTNIPVIKNWPQLASADPAQHENWSREFPRCNFGLLTGDGVGVLDLDTKSDPEGYGGFKSLIDVEEALGITLNGLPLVRTFSGAHLYFRYEGLLPSRVPWVPFIDVKADGGHQVAVPGTVREVDGVERTYELKRGSFDDIPYAPAPLMTALLSWRAVSARAGSSGGGGSAVDLPATGWLREHGFRLGHRDNGFNSLAWRLTRHHWPHMDLVSQIAYEVWLHTDNPPNDPLPWSKVQQQIARAEERIGPDEQRMRSWAQSLRSDDE